MIDRADVLAIFSSQFWVADIAQLKEAGVSARTITRARQRGTIVGVLPGIVRLAGSELTFESKAMALQLHAGEKAFLSGVTAGALHGMRQMPRSFLEITVPEVSRAVMPRWGRVSRTSWIDPDRDVQERDDGLRVATPLRTLFRLARTFNDHRFERAAEDAWHLELVTPEAAADYLTAIRRQGKWGVTRFERWLEKTAARTRPSQSGLELDVPRRGAAGRAARTGTAAPADAAQRRGRPRRPRWPRARLGVEPGHSWWHGGDLGQRSDQARDRACDEIGWRIVRHDESLRGQLAAFGLQLRIIHDERLRSFRPA